MSVRSGFFNSSNGDRKYDAEDIGNYFRGLITNGVLEAIDNRLQVTAGEGLSVNVDTGQAFVNCHWLINDAMLSLSLAAADVQYSRIDRVVLRLDTSDSVRAINIAVLKGENSLNPTAPALTRGVSVHELCLAEIYVAANATTINQTNITDKRADTALCGFVTSLVDQVDTSDLYAQYEAAFSQKANEFDAYMIAQRANFDAWYQTLTEELTVDVDLSLGQYQNIINLTADTSEISIGIAEYEIGDLLFVYVNGVLFSEGIDYTISTEKKIIFNDVLDSDNTITLICIKSVARNFGDISEILGKISAVTAEADTNSGTPTVEATLGGTEDAPTLHFAFRNIKGADGKSISSITRKFARSSSNSTAPTSWQDTVPTLTATYRYLWSYDIITFTDGTAFETPVGVYGVYGNSGATGATPNLSMGTVNTLEAGADATANITGTAAKPVLNLGIPKGDTGSDGYTIVLSKETHIFEGAGKYPDGKQSVNVAVKAYKGATQIPVTIGEISNLGTGVSVRYNNNGNAFANFTVTVEATMPNQSGLLTVPLTIDGKSFTRYFSFAVAYTGETPDLKIGTVETLAAGTAATASIAGTAEKPVLNLGIPKGGTGATPDLKIGTVETLAAGSDATASITGSAEKPVLNLGIPEGKGAVTGEVLFSGTMGNTQQDADLSSIVINNIAKYKVVICELYGGYNVLCTVATSSNNCEIMGSMCNNTNDDLMSYCVSILCNPTGVGVINVSHKVKDTVSGQSKSWEKVNKIIGIC